MIFRSKIPSATHVSDQEFVPIEPLMYRNLNARETAALVRITLAVFIAALVFFIGVFGVLSAIANAVGSGLGLHDNYPDIVGTH